MNGICLNCSNIVNLTWESDRTRLLLLYSDLITKEASGIKHTIVNPCKGCGLDVKLEWNDSFMSKILQVPLQKYNNDKEIVNAIAKSIPFNAEMLNYTSQAVLNEYIKSTMKKKKKIVLSNYEFNPKSKQKYLRAIILKKLLWIRKVKK